MAPARLPVMQAGPEPPVTDHRLATRRLVVVRAGAVALYRALSRRFADDLTTEVILDRRRAVGPHRSACPGGERRFPQDAAVLLDRGFYVVRVWPESRQR